MLGGAEGVLGGAEGELGGAGLTLECCATVIVLLC